MEKDVSLPLVLSTFPCGNTGVLQEFGTLRNSCLIGIHFNSTRVKHLAQFIAYKKPDSDFVFSRRYGYIGVVRGYCQLRNKERKGFS